MNDVVSRSNNFNKVQRIWKATPEYYSDPWQYYVDFINILKARGARFITMSDALDKKFQETDINILLDHHIDYYPIETEVMCRWELENEVISSIYLFNRFEYYDSSQLKIWDVENLNIDFYKDLESKGFEIGYHQNAVGLVRVSRTGRTYDKNISRDDIEKAKAVFALDVDNLSRYFNIRTFIPHGAGEANAHLTELPDGYERLTWVYNNAHRNKSMPSPIEWQNYSDSCGQRTQRIRGSNAHYLLHIDNLHVKAYLAEPGLHHILIHPGRFGKGMPYHMYSGTIPDETTTSVNLEFEASDNENLPLSSAALISSWEGNSGKKRRRANWKLHSDSATLMDISSKYYLLCDDITVLRNHMAHNELCVPFYLIQERHDSNKKKEMIKSLPSSKYARVSDLCAPVESAHEDQDYINELFLNQFRPYFNLVYTSKVLKHLITSSIKYDCLYLSNLLIKNSNEISLLLNTLDKYANAQCVVINAKVVGLELKSWLKRLSSDLKKKYVINYSTISSDEIGLFIITRQFMNFRVKDVLRNAVFKGINSFKTMAKFIVSHNAEHKQKAKNTHVSKKKKNDMSLLNIADLTVEDKNKLERLSAARMDSIDETFNRFRDSIKSIPRSFNKHTNNLLRFDFPEAGLSEGMPYVKLPNGRIFYGALPNKKTRREFAFLKDRVSPALTDDTYLTALDITSRYLTDFSWYPKELLPSEGGTVVEAGAYVGHKTIRFVDDAVGTSGKVLAIEMMPDNVQVLRRNVKENNLDKCIDIVECGVWNEKGETLVMGKGRQRNSLVPLDQLKPDIVISVPVNSLDNILQSWGKDIIDFLVLTVNGAEVEALRGLDTMLNHIKVIYIAACYTRDGQSTYATCMEILKERGCVILPHSNDFVIYASPARYANEFV